jgi:hypothetical protein
MQLLHLAVAAWMADTRGFNMAAKKKPMDKVLKDVGDSVESLVKNALDSLGVATKEDVKAINSRLSKLEKKVAPKRKPAKKKATKKTTKKKPAKKKTAKKKPAKKK